MKNKKIYFLQNSSEKIGKEEVINAELETYFDEFQISFEFLVPCINDNSEENDFIELSFSYMFEFYKDKNGKIEICFNDENETTINIIEYNIDIKQLKNVIKEESIENINFYDFILNARNQMLESLNKIESKDFFNYQNKSVTFDQNLKKDLIISFKEKTKELLLHLKTKNKTYENVDVEDFKRLKNVVKNINTVFEFNLMKKELNLKQENKEIKRKI